MATPSRLAQVQLGTTDTEIGTCPADVMWVVTSVLFANTTASPIVASFHHVRPSESAGCSTSNAVVYNFTVAANSTESLLNGTDRMVLIEDDELRGLAASAGITVTVYGAYSTV